MTAPHSYGLSSRLLDVVFPSPGHLMAIYEGYFDESGGFDEDPRIFCVSGYYLESEQAKAMAAEWSQVLVDHGIPYFHMVDCAHRNGVFGGKSRDECIEIEKKCIALIKKYTLYGFSVVSKAEYFEPSEKHPDEYAMCVDSCIGALKAFLAANQLDGDIAYFFETGHKSKGMVYNLLARRLEADGTPITFVPKAKFPILQAGDLLAWQTRKYTQDAIGNIRPPRMDMLDLLQHPHSLVFVSVKDGETNLTIADWPQNRRSQRTVVLTSHNDDPLLPHFTEDDDPTPIFLVSKSLGWRVGGGKLIYLGLESAPIEKKFALAFTDERLIEFKNEVMHAASIAAGWSSRGFYFDVEKTWVETEGQAPVLCITDNRGTRINLRMSQSVVDVIVAGLSNLKSSS